MTLAKKSIALGLAGFVTLAAVTPSMAQRWEPWAAAGAGFAAGAVIGGAAANARAFGPGYAYGPGYDSYAYQPETYGYPVYRRSGQFGNYDSGYKSCATDGQYNRTDYSAC